ncbi:hypothetical protein CVS30_09615 [Arthrobacter psychrolactophilus]|uniref:DUF3040 domain-containing protein n=1 Tax=Arthrobacter psychrolactophilus TaxID=92442 RepID=A0A2V5JLD2_9MICC|nr:DUF3040 domain-containing protein [Arthrobacter psychrolactophilus]PYI38576.1 hypothetical protein CVS30_09615 [Arthrobacter psychrolactophilus]
MPLSEHEQRLLDQLEQQLHAEDPKFAQALSSEAKHSMSMRNVVIGVLIVIVGLVGVLGAVALKILLLGVFGFLVMGGGVYLALAKSKSASGSQQSTRAGGNGGAKQKGGFMNGLEEKWEERRRQQ